MHVMRRCLSIHVHESPTTPKHFLSSLPSLWGITSSFFGVSTVDQLSLSSQPSPCWRQPTYSRRRLFDVLMQCYRWNAVAKSPQSDEKPYSHYPDQASSYITKYWKFCTGNCTNQKKRVIACFQRYFITLLYLTLHSPKWMNFHLNVVWLNFRRRRF